MPDMIANLEAMLAAGRDTALLRYTLGTQYFDRGEVARAVAHLCEAVRMDPDYSAAWKAYGKALTSADDLASAANAYRRGIEVARQRGDMQAAKEMQVFLKRVQRRMEPGGDA